jgi:hypothetical protein
MNVSSFGAQLTVSIESVNSGPNANSSSLKGVFAVVATVFQQFVTNFNGNELKEDRIIAIIKIILPLMKQNDS